MRAPTDATRDVAYAALAAMVVALTAAHAINRHWAGDFWEHAAVVRELSRHPWSPTHPLFALDAPHPFSSPYALALGLVARLTGVAPTTVLAAAGVVNVAALLIALWFFVRALAARHAAVYALACTLLMWGEDPWRYSGFLHLNALGFAAPYPSIFAFWVMLAALAALRSYLGTGRTAAAVVVAMAAPVVLITHPITGIALGAGLVALSLDALGTRPDRVIGVGALVAAVAIAGVAAWPYYPWFSLITMGSGIYAEPNLAVYDGVLRRAWPLALGVPFVVARLRRNPQDPLGLYVVVLGALYVLGAILQNGPLGRVLPALALGLHIALADAIARTVARAWPQPSRLPRLAIIGIAVVVVIAALANMSAGLVRGIPLALLPSSVANDPRLERAIDVYRPIAPLIGPDDVVMASVPVSRFIPALSGRVVGFIDPEAFVADELERRQAIFRFYTDIGADERRAILARYNAAFVLVDRTQLALSPSLAAFLGTLGSVAYDDGRLLLVRIAADGAGAPGQIQPR